MDQSTGSRINTTLKSNLPLNTREFNDACIKLNLFDPEIMGVGTYLQLRYLQYFLRKQEQKQNDEKKKLQKFYSNEINQYTNIYHLSELGKANFFIDSIGEFYESFMNSGIKLGILQSKSKHFGRWQDKRASLDTSRKLLTLQKGEKIQQFEIVQYMLSAEIETGNQHFRFRLIAKSKDTKQKEVVLGSTFKEIAEIWFNCISSVIHPPTMKSIVVKPEDRTGSFDGSQRSKSNEKSSNNIGGGILTQSMMHLDGEENQVEQVKKNDDGMTNKNQSKSTIVQQDQKPIESPEQGRDNQPKMIVNQSPEKTHAPNTEVERATIPRKQEEKSTSKAFENSTKIETEDQTKKIVQVNNQEDQITVKQEKDPQKIEHSNRDSSNNQSLKVDTNPVNNKNEIQHQIIDDPSSNNLKQTSSPRKSPQSENVEEKQETQILDIQPISNEKQEIKNNEAQPITSMEKQETKNLDHQPITTEKKETKNSEAPAITSSEKKETKNLEPHQKSSIEKTETKQLDIQPNIPIEKQDQPSAVRQSENTKPPLEIQKEKIDVKENNYFPPTPPKTPPSGQRNAETEIRVIGEEFKQDELKEIHITDEYENSEAHAQQQEQVPIEVQLKNFERKVNVPQIFKQLVPIIDIDDLQSQFNYKVAHTKDSLRILQNLENKKQFKLIMTLKANQEKVFDIISNTQHYNQWNPNINETKIISLMKSDNTAIIYQKNKAYGKLYKSRDFVFLRYAFYKNGIYHIIDQSIDHENYPPYYTIVRGEIDHFFWCIMKHPDNPNDSILIKDFEISNAGYVSEQQDGNMTLEYLKCFQHLDNFLRQVSFQIYDQNNFANIFDLSNDIKYYEEHKSNQKQDQLKKLAQSQQNYQIDDELVIEQEPKTHTHDIEVNSFNMEEPDSQNQRGTVEEKVQIDHKEENMGEKIFKQEIITNINNDTNSKNNNQTEVTVNNLNNQEDEEKEEQLFQRNRRSESLFVQEEQFNYSSKKPNGSTTQEKQNRILDLVDQNDHERIYLKHQYQLYACQKNQRNEVRVKNSPKDHYIFREDWRRDDAKGTMYFVNKEALEAQKKVIKFLLKQLGGNLLSGKSLTTISMPVDIFECRSNLERFAYSFSFAPIYFEAAAKSSDPVEQMKNVVTFTLSMSLMYLNLQKPFNPILGETYQGFINGCPIYCEQISHHPPIAAFQLFGRGYVLEGYLESTAEFHANSVTGMNFGKLKVRFENTKAEFFMFTCPGELFNTAIGDRYFNLQGQLLVYEEKYSLIADVNFNPDKKGALSFSQQKTPSDFFSGAIYQLNGKGMQKLMKQEQQWKYKGVNPKDEIQKELAKVEGIWTQYLRIDGLQYWQRNDPLPYIMIDEQYPLASDCNYRKDIIYRRLNDRLKSQQWKEKMEVFQRTDRKNREKYEQDHGIQKKKH